LKRAYLLCETASLLPDVEQLVDEVVDVELRGHAE